MDKVFITGITGQDGSYLAEQCLNKGYEVHGLVRRSSVDNMERLLDIEDYITLHPGDMTTEQNLRNTLLKVNPDEIYNLAAQSHVGTSFKQPSYTIDADGLGFVRILEYVKNHNPDCKVYQASTSELFGSTPPPQDENTEFKPVSPYACAKMIAHDMARIYRDSYDLDISCGILFNHESSRRGKNFVTQKIATQTAEIALGLRDKIYLGNLESKRDWGYAPDYTQAMQLINRKGIGDYVVATGETHTVKEFVTEAFKSVGTSIIWDGAGINEIGIAEKTGNIVVAVKEKFYRPIDVEALQGDATKIKEELGWKPTVSFKQLVKHMVMKALENRTIKVQKRG